MNAWSEELPDLCPPKEAFNPDGKVFYRLIESSMPNESDFESQRAMCPDCTFNVSECIARSLSIWDDIDKCLNILKLPRHRGKAAIAILFTPSDGVIQQTFKSNHYSWWKTQSFNIASVKAI